MQWFFALRYLISRSSHSVINIIAGVSLVSVAIPVAAMVILLSVFNGFEGIVKGLYAQTDADIEIANFGGRSEQFREAVLSVDGVQSASFVVEGQVLAVSNERELAVDVRGADSLYFDVLPIDAATLQGKAQLTLGQIDYAILTHDVSRLLGIYTIATSRVTLHSLGGGEVGSLLPLYGIRQCRLHVGGIIRSSQQQKGQVLVSLRAAEALFGEGGYKLLVRCSGDAAQVKSKLQAVVGSDATVTTRAEKNSLFYQIMRYEKWAVFFVALLVLIIASLSIIGTVIMLIVEKRSQQQTLFAMGADRAFIRGIFVREGLLISGIGGLVGLVIGVVLVLVQQIFGVIRMPSSGFVVDSYPVELQGTDIVAVFITFVVIAWVVSQVAANSMIKKR